MRRHDYYNVKLPADGPFETREQVWAALARHVSELTTLVRRAGLVGWSGEPEQGSPLDAQDGERLKRAIERLDRAADWLTMDTIEQLATLAPPERRNGVEYTPAVDALLDEYHGDFATWLRERPKDDNSDEILLAVSLLERAGYEEETGDILKKLAERDTSRYERNCYLARSLKPEFQARETKDNRQVHECPRCGTSTELLDPDTKRKATCRRCNGRGYVIQHGAPPEYENMMSDLGKWTLNTGRPWSFDDEAKHLREDYDQNDEDDEDRYQQRLADLESEGWART